MIKLFIRLFFFGAFLALPASSTEAASSSTLSPTDIRKIAKTFNNVTLRDTWTPGVCVRDFPEEISRNLRYFLLGYTFQGRPVLLLDNGAWPVKRLTEANEMSRQLVHLYMEQLWCRVHNLTSPIEGAEEGVMIIGDLGNFQASEVTSLEAIKVHLLFGRLGEKYEAAVADYWLVRTNFVVSAWANLIKPVAGRIVGRIEDKGPRQEAFLPALASQMDIKILPPYLGGTSGDKWKPVAVWG